MIDGRQLAVRAVRASERPLRARWRAVVLARGEDVTARSSASSCLVLAPHPDDETIGCGATIARKRATGTPVRVVVAADGRSSHRSAVIDPETLARIRSDEVAAACGVLGVAEPDLVRLGFEDDTLAARIDELTERIADELDTVRPDEVLVAASRDWHVDHRALNAALRRVLQGRANPPRVLEYPVWYWIHGPWDADPAGPWPRRRPAPLARGFLRPSAWRRAQLVATRGYLGQKRRALLAHRSQTTNLSGEPGWAVLDEDFVAAFLMAAEPAFPLRGT